MRENMRKRSIVKAGITLLLALTMIFGLVACGGNTPQVDDRGWPTSITIMQFPDEGNPRMGQLHDSFRYALQEHLGIEVNELLGGEFAVGIEAARAGNLDVMMVTPMSYFQAIAVADVEPLVTFSVEAIENYTTVFITRADRDDINTLEDARGRTFAFVDPASSSGYMVPAVFLVEEMGLDVDQLVNPGYFFETVAFSGQHQASIMGILMGDFDVAAVGYPVIGMMGDAIDPSELKIIARTAPIPQPMYVIRSDLPRDLIDAILEFYLQFADEDYFESLHGSASVRFIRAYHEDYMGMYRMIQMLGLGS